ncbi:glycosyltransferase [Bacillus cereus]
MVTVSLCIIVKDEEKIIERCLKSVIGIPDEIIIIDTGSKDNTKNIANKWTEKVLDFEWEDDFSAARNFSFQHATMDYIFWLDADDILLPEDRQKLLELKESLDSTVDAVSMEYNVLFDSNNNIVTSTRRFRLLKRDKNFKWHGIVHEDLQIPEKGHYYHSDIIVTHKKEGSSLNRNLEIYERALKKGKILTPQDIFNYARELQVNNKYQDALHMYQKYLNTGDVSSPYRVFIYHNMACCYHTLGEIEKEHELTLQSFSQEIPQPMFCCRMGEYFIRQQKFLQAIFWYNMATEVPTTNLDVVIQQPIYKTWLPHKQLGLCYYHMGDYKNSYKHNQKVLEYLPSDPDTLINIETLETLIKNN